MARSAYALYLVWRHHRLVRLIGKDPPCVADLRHRPPQPRHGLDRLGDRLRRAEAALDPATSTSPSASASSTRRPAGCSSAAGRRAPELPAPRPAARARRHARATSRSPATTRAGPRGRPGDGRASDLDLVPVVDDDGALAGVMTERALARRYIRESREASSLVDAPTTRRARSSTCSRASCVAGEDARASPAASGSSRWTSARASRITEGDVVVVGDRADAQRQRDRARRRRCS